MNRPTRRFIARGVAPAASFERPRTGAAASRWLVAAAVAPLMAACGDEEPDAPNVPVFDLVQQERSVEAYRAEIGRVDIIDFRVEAPQPRPLYVNHSVEVKLSVDVDAEPFQTDFTYGLRDGAGNFCLVGRIEADHLPEMFDAARLANQTLAEHKPPVGEPTLAACEPGDTCATEGEECLGFSNLGADGNPETSYLCTTVTWAVAAAYGAADLGATIEPGDLAGSVVRSYDLERVDLIPADCAPLAGAAGLHAWIAFDTSDVTEVLGREIDEPEVPTEAPTTFEEGEVDPTALLRADAQRAYDLRFAFEAPFSTVLRADPGPNLQVEHVRLPSAVVPIRERPTGDGNASPAEIDATVIFDVEGGDAAALAELAASRVAFTYTLRPTGEPEASCLSVGADVAALSAATTLRVVHSASDGTTQVVESEPVAAGGGEQRSHTVALALPDAFRASLFRGDMQCWRTFEVKACASTDGDQVEADGAGEEDDCATAPVQFDTTRFAALPEGEVSTDEIFADTVNAETNPDAMLDDAVEFATTGTCSSGLIAEYQRLRNLYEAALVTAKVTQYYTTDWAAFVEGVTFGGGWYHCNDRRYGSLIGHPRHNWRGIVDGILQCTRHYAETGNFDTFVCWVYPAAQRGGCLDGDYNSVVRPYFLPGSFDSFRNDPTTFTQNYFEFACRGLATGSACPTDMAQVPQFVSDIRALAGMVADVKARGGTTNDISYWWRVFGDRLGGDAGNRCYRVGMPMLQRATVSPSGEPIVGPDDGAFYNNFVPELCQRADYRRRADAVWAQIAANCGSVAKPFNRSGWNVNTGTFSDEVYKSFDVNALSISTTLEGGIVNRWYADRSSQQMEAVVGPQARVVVQGTGDLDFIRIYDVFRVWALVHLYSNVLSSYAEFGLHALTFDLWRTEFSFPTREFELPSPPPISKESERCKYLYKPPIPARLQLCGGVGGELGMGLTINVRRAGIGGDPDDAESWPELQGAATPYVSISTFASAAIDIFFLKAGAKLTLDPTVRVDFPVQTGARFDLAVVPGFTGIDIKFWPFFRTAVEVRAFGGEVSLFAKSSLLGLDGSFTIYDWDPIELWGRELFLLDRRLSFPVRW